MGTGIEAGKAEGTVSIDYVAPTLSKAMRIRAPNGCDRSPLW